MSIWDSIFGVVGGPASMAVDGSADTRGASIAAVGGLGGTGIEAAAGDDPRAVGTGLATDQILGSIAATVGTLGAAAPAAAAATTATTAATAAPAASAVAAPIAAETTAEAIPAVAAPTAASAIAPTASAVAPTTEVGLGSIEAAAPTPIAAASGSSVVPATETAINEVSGEGAKALSTKSAFKVANTTINTVKKSSDLASAQDALDRPKSPQQEIATPKPSAPITAGIGGNNQFDAIFGSSGSKSMANPNYANQISDPLNVPAAPNPSAPIQTPAPTLIKPQPQRSFQDFYSQLNGNKY